MDMFYRLLNEIERWEKKSNGEQRRESGIEE